MISQVEINPAGAGTATFRTEPYSGSGSTGTYIIPTATPNAGWEFDYYFIEGRLIYDSGTEDQHNRSSAANPPMTADEKQAFLESRNTFLGTRIVIDRITAYFRSGPTPPPTYDSAILLSLVSSPQGVGTLTGGGQRSGVVGSSVSFTANAAVSAASSGVYRFSHWIDDEGMKHKTKQLSKNFTLKSGYTTSNPERKTFTAYFVPYTGLILRSGSSGLILRGSNNKILRDE